MRPDLFPKKHLTRLARAVPKEQSQSILKKTQQTENSNLHGLSYIDPQARVLNYCFKQYKQSSINHAHRKEFL